MPHIHFSYLHIGVCCRYLLSLVIQLFIASLSLRKAFWPKALLPVMSGWLIIPTNISGTISTNQHINVNSQSTIRWLCYEDRSDCCRYGYSLVTILLASGILKNWEHDHMFINEVYSIFHLIFFRNSAIFGIRSGCSYYFRVNSAQAASIVNASAAMLKTRKECQL